jgi:hypothetical protein
MGKLKDALNKIWPWFQSNYDRIKAWELPSGVEELFDATWDVLDDSIKDALYKFIKANYDKYGKEFAMQLLEKVLKALKLKLG